MVCTKNKNSIRGKRYRLRIETSQILAFNFSKSKAGSKHSGSGYECILVTGNLTTIFSK